MFVARADVTDADELREALDSLDALLGTPDVVLSNTSMFVEATLTVVRPDVFRNRLAGCLPELSLGCKQVVPRA
jgi:NAD(P)-dependent dehydrogenase (short-subunit alcohol dehydrogenase family)